MCIFKMFRYLACFISNKHNDLLQITEKPNPDSLIYHYDIIHKNKSVDYSRNFTEMEYNRTLSEIRSIQKKLPGRRSCLF